MSELQDLLKTKDNGKQTAPVKAKAGPTLG